MTSVMAALGAAGGGGVRLAPAAAGTRGDVRPLVGLFLKNGRRV